MPAKPEATAEEWVTVAEARTKIIFDTDGDEWEGWFEGFEDITNPNTGEIYIYLNFHGPDDKAYTTSGSYQLEKAFRAIEPGTYCRMTRLSTTKTAHGDMIDFKIQVRK